MEKTVIPMARRLAGFIAGCNAGGIPPLVYEHAKVAFLDWLGITIGDPLVKKLVAYSELMVGERAGDDPGYKAGLRQSHAKRQSVTGQVPDSAPFCVDRRQYS